MANGCGSVTPNKWVEKRPGNWPIVGLAFVGMIQARINLIRPDWTWLRTAEQIFIGVATLVLWGYLLKPGQWILADPER